MLQKAANNAYSWWWASHVRTKQSKWLEQNLQDMEEKVGSVLKLIEEDGDSFRKRAEMYYKKRPELISFVEESYRAYRALAERYDHISKELQNANHTIATVFPEQVQFGMEDDDDYASPRFHRRPPESSKTDVPKVPELPVADSKGQVAAGTKKFQPKKLSKTAAGSKVAKSGLSKQEGLQEIDKLQRRILALQTEKEFVKNSYESGLAKYWDIEKEIEELQEKAYSLQDEFGAGLVIEDDEAWNLMSAAALKSCQEALGQLQEKHQKSAEEAKLEGKRIKDARKKLDSLKDELLPDEVDQEKPSSGAGAVRTEENLKMLDQEAVSGAEATKDLVSLREKIKEHFDVEFSGFVTVSQMVEKIDELVSKAVSLETAVSSQAALIQRLKTETDDLQAQIRTLEDDKATLLDGKNDLSNKLRRMEEKWSELQDLKQSVEDQNCDLQIHFTEAHCNLEHLSEKLPSVQMDKEPEATSTSQVEESSLPDTVPTDGLKKLKSMEPDEKLEVVSFPIEEKSFINVERAEVSREQVDTFHLDGGSTVIQSVGMDGRVDLKENDPLTASGNQTEISLEQQEIADEHASSQTVGNLPKVELKESGAGEQKDEPAGNSRNESEVILEWQGNTDRNASSEKVNNLPEVDQQKLAAAREGNEIDWTPRIESGGCLEQQGTTDQHASPQTLDNIPHLGPSEPAAAGQEDEPDWKLLFLNGMDDKEKILLSEYTAALRNYKEMKKTVTELETKNQTSLLEIKVQLNDIKNDNFLKDEEIQCLRQKLKLFQAEINQKDQCNCQHVSVLMDKQSAESTVACEQPNMMTTTVMQSTENKANEEDRLLLFLQPQTISPVEEKFRMSIDELLEENLDFWLRFSNSFSQIQKFDTEVKDLQADVSKLEKRHKQDGSSNSKYSLKTDIRPLYKHLREVETQLAVWVEKSVLLKEELKSRFASLCDVQEEIKKALKESAEDDEFTFTSYQVAKFQGEILNMKQENNKVAEELQAGLDHVTALQLEVERALAKMTAEFGLSESKSSAHLHRAETRSRVPLRAFIFDVSEKKHKSIFSIAHPALYRKNQPLR